MSKYWEDRLVDELDNFYNSTASQIEAQMLKQYKIVAQKLRVKLRSLYNEILAATKDGTLLVSDLYKFQHYFDLLNDSNILLRQLGESQIATISQDLIDYYNGCCSVLGTNFGVGNHISNTFAERAVNSIWCQDGKTWSQRIWSDKSKLLQALEEGLTECVATGAKTDDAVKMLMSNFNTSFNNASRLVRTEMSHVQNEASIDVYQSSGVEEVQFLDTEDERTCELCSSMNGKVYQVQDARGVIPVHCFCRCTWIPVIKRSNNVSN